VSVADVESALRGSPYFRSAIVTPDREGELIALVDLDIEAVGRWASVGGVSYRSPSALRDSDEVRQLIRDEIATTNEKLAARRLPRIADAVPSPGPFAVGREVGPTWSPRRRPAIARTLGNPEEDLSHAS
jgi:long-subunit acyl-CoA synthetase (AMP-forming)